MRPGRAGKNEGSSMKPGECQYIGGATPWAGICQCGETFVSKHKKKFCTVKCYLGSAHFRAINEARNERQRTGKIEPCAICGAEVHIKPSHKNKRYCSRQCWREGMAKRFDSAVADPVKLRGLPQCFDEFLSQDELSCLVNGCTWRGSNLSNHMNFTHGIRADEFKRMVGFNISTGVVSQRLSRLMSARPTVGIVKQMKALGISTAAFFDYQDRRRPYYSLEAKEHQIKARAEKNPYTGAAIVCKGCTREFTPQWVTPQPMVFCSKPCCQLYRDKRLTAERRATRPRPTCQTCGLTFAAKQSAKWCSRKCRKS